MVTPPFLGKYRRSWARGSSLPRILGQGPTGRLERKDISLTYQSVALLMMANRPTVKGWPASTSCATLPSNKDGIPTERGPIRRSCKWKGATSRSSGQDSALTDLRSRSIAMAYPTTVEGRRAITVGATLPSKEDGKAPLRSPWASSIKESTTSFVS